MEKQRELIETPTQVETGITENIFLDYFLFPFLLTLLIFIVFRKKIISLVKKIE